jgi:uncharacterized protein with NRDE domain
MCTCSWLRCPGGYDLMFNRDEAWSRQAALLPRLLVRNNARILAPIDADAGGTWLGVNAFGLSIGLLNRYQDQQPPVTTAPAQPWISRGILVRNLLDSRTVADVQSRFESIDLARFQPFTLIVLAPDSPSLLLEWNGRRLHVDPDADHVMPLASSSFDTANALAYRSALLTRIFAAHGRAPDALRIFHATQEAGRAPYGPCMRRDDAHTVSFSWIRVRSDGIRFEYTPQALCDGDSAHVITPFEVCIRPAGVSEHKS